MSRGVSVFVLLALVLGCGVRIADSSTDAQADDDVNDGDDHDGAPKDVGGVVGDPWNCGDEEYRCIGPMGIGECIDDECTGHLSLCRTGDGPCDAACSAYSGAICVEAGCKGATAYGWAGSTPEEAIDLCLYPHPDDATPLALGCDDPLPVDEFQAIRCCCKWD